MDLAWRVSMTGLCFAILGLGGSFLAATVFPALSLSIRDRAERSRRVQELVHLSFRGYIRVLEALGLIELRVEGAQEIRTCRGKVIIANHPTLLDVVLLMALNARTKCIVKGELWHNPFLKGVVQAAGYIRNDLSADELTEACGAALAAGDNLIIFPEGTRTQPGRPLRLHRGFANIALMARADIFVVSISCHPITLTKGTPWWRVPARRPTIRVASAGTIAIDDFQTSVRSRDARRLADYAHARLSGFAAY
ncbi:MAG: 1-acyl-sn-glycerol-3-phosphate acyltransferase [Rhodospirillales bacterium]|nr:1-acyl-sn-glycerol-3-phosphate acyltransferase [Rhodospirillales bacterium]